MYGPIETSRHTISWPVCGSGMAGMLSPQLRWYSITDDNDACVCNARVHARVHVCTYVYMRREFDNNALLTFV